MTRQELIEKLEFLFIPQNEIGLVMYCIVEGDNELEIKKADITVEVRTHLKTQFLNYINQKFIGNPDLYFTEITNADNRKNAAFHYDLANLPDGLEVMGEVLLNEEKPFFNFNTDDFGSVIGYVFLLGNEVNKVALYKKQYPISVLRQDSVLMLKKADTRLVKVDDDIIKLNDSFEFMQIEEDLIILSLKTLERNFGFEDVIRTEATNNLNIIQATNLLEDISTLQELTIELKYAKKLMRVRANSPVLQLPFETVRNFIQNHPKLRRRMRFSADNSQISLDTRASKELFLKLLDDDFLKSELTNLLYESDIKNAMDNLEEND